MSEEDEALERLAATYREQREDGDPNRTEYGFMVVLTVDNRHMNKAQVEHELRKSIEFGGAFVTLPYNVRAPCPVEVATDTSGRL